MAAASVIKVVGSTTILRTDLAARTTGQDLVDLVGMADRPGVGMAVAPAALEDTEDHQDHQAEDRQVEDMEAEEVGISSEKAPVGTTTVMRNDPAISMTLSYCCSPAPVQKVILSLVCASALRKWQPSYSRSLYTLLFVQRSWFTIIDAT